MSTSGSNWSELANKFAFAPNTAINLSTCYTPYEIVFGLKNHAHTEHKSNNETIDRFLKNQTSAEILKRENYFKLIYSNTYTHCHRITNKAHMFQNQFKLGRPIKEGTKVLLENRSEPLLKSQIPYVTEVTYGIQNDFTNEKKIVHRNHIVEYFPKEQQMPKLLQEYSSDLFSSDFYDQITNQQINSFNKPKQVENLQYQFWPVFINGYQQMTDNNPTNEDQNKTIVQEQSLDSGRETLHLRNLFDATAIDQNLRPIRSSTPYPVDNTPNPSTSQSSSYGHRRLPSRSKSPNTSLSNDFGRRHPNIITRYNTPRPPDFPRLSESSESFTDRKNTPHSSQESFYENTRSAPGSLSETKRPKRTNRPTIFYETTIPSSKYGKFKKK